MLGIDNNSLKATDTGLSSLNKIVAKQPSLPIETEPFRSFEVNTLLAGEVFNKRPIIIVSHGAIGLQHLLKDGRRTISTIFLSNEVLDVRHFRKADGRLVCLTPVEVHLMKAEHFEQLKRESSEVRAALAASHYRQCGFTARHCVDLARKSAVEKLASFIFECQNRQMIEKGNSICLILKRIDIADYMGLRPETLSRAFASLKKHQIIHCDGSDHIDILDVHTLRQIANGAIEQFG